MVGRTEEVREGGKVRQREGGKERKEVEQGEGDERTRKR